MVFSTYVEMILNWRFVIFLEWSILHVCGDDPVIGQQYTSHGRYSPRMWRWSLLCYSIHLISTVFSTYVEMILTLDKGDNNDSLVFSTYVEMILNFCKYCLALDRILHVCGDDPTLGLGVMTGFQYSPRMWRWSLIALLFYHQIQVFSTYVEMILIKTLQALIYQRILHVCGDDPCFHD